MGPLKLVGTPRMFPIISQRAAALAQDRCALIAEAAHVVPPIGAQGLNMSLGDIALLRDLIADAPEQIGSPEMLAQYARGRGPVIMTRLAGVDALNRASIADAPGLAALRGLGLRALRDATPLRRLAMRAGLAG